MVNIAAYFVLRVLCFIYIQARVATDRGEVLQNLSVLLPALGEAPVILVQVGVEVVQHGHLLVQGDAHVILHRVQCSQHQVENTNCMSAGGKGQEWLLGCLDQKR